jgi:hypothetical protein
VLPRRGVGGRAPYTLGPHTLRAEVEFLSGRRARLQVHYLVATALDAPSEVSSAALEAAIHGVQAGPVLVRPRRGEQSFSVDGDISLDRPFVVIERARVSGTVVFKPGSSDSRLVSSSALGFDIFGADRVRLQGNRFDGRNVDSQNLIWDEPAGNTPDNWVIRNNTFENYFIDDGYTHSEALFVGYSTRGLIEGNTFTNNGSTAHIFFTWFGNKAEPWVSYPREMCVRGNTFNATPAYYDVNLREEIPSSARIRVQRNATISDQTFHGNC